MQKIIVWISNFYVCYFVCLLDGSPYGRLWEGSSPRPQSRITHLTRINVDNFIFHKVLGKGSFGKVQSNRVSVN